MIMKKNAIIYVAVIALTIFFSGCTKEKVVVEVTGKIEDVNVSDKKLDNKSGGVYFVSTLVGEYIFRLNLKNGDNNMICDMLHNESYSKLPGQKTEWNPGKELRDYEFSGYGVKLIIDIDELGTAQAKVIVGEKEYETVVFKATEKEPVKVYYGTYLYISVIIPLERRNEENEIRIFILQNEKYYYGRKDINKNRERYIIGNIEEIKYHDEIKMDIIYFEFFECEEGWLNSTNCSDRYITKLPLNKDGVIYEQYNEDGIDAYSMQNFNMPLRFQD